jgi:DNA-binding transcriptional MocR family regulator
MSAIGVQTSSVHAHNVSRDTSYDRPRARSSLCVMPNRRVARRDTAATALPGYNEPRLGMRARHTAWNTGVATVHPTIDRSSPTPVYVQIARHFRQAIVDGELRAGAQLPPERRLAALLGVNRTTVVNAYRELAADGLVPGQVGRGTLVSYGQHRDDDDDASHSGSDGGVVGQVWSRGAGSGPLASDRITPAAVPWPHLFTTVTDGLEDPLLRDAMTVSARPDVIRFATGIPAPELYPIETIRRLFDEALHHSGQALLQHTPTEGFPPLREQLANWMAAGAAQAGLGVTFQPHEVVVAAGSQQGLYLLARTLIEPGDLVAVESPTYLGAVQVFRAAGARMLPIPVDGDGMQVDLLQDLLARRRPKLIYTLPTFQNPSGAVLSMGRRRRLLDLAARHQIPIIEDDPYGALRYGGRAVPSLAALDREAGRDERTGVVIYLSTVSKMLFPGFRIGWIAGPRPVIERVTLMKQLVDLDTNALAQWAVWAFFERGLLAEHLERTNRLYPARRDRMLDALARHTRGVLRVNRPDGGIYLWCRLADGLRVRDLLPEAARHGVVVAPGESFHVDAASGRGRAYVRLNYTLPNESEIEEGVRRLGLALQRLAEQLAPADGRRADEELTPIV